MSNHINHLKILGVLKEIDSLINNYEGKIKNKDVNLNFDDFYEKLQNLGDLLKPLSKEEGAKYLDDLYYISDSARKWHKIMEDQKNEINMHIENLNKKSEAINAYTNKNANNN